MQELSEDRLAELEAMAKAAERYVRKFRMDEDVECNSVDILKSDDFEEQAPAAVLALIAEVKRLQGMLQGMLQAECETLAWERRKTAELQESIAAERAKVAKLRDALTGMLGIVDDSSGVAGYHQNGGAAEWDEFEEVEAARAALAETEDRHA